MASVHQTGHGDLCDIFSPNDIIKPFYWGVIDMWKAVHVYYIQLDAFGYNYTPVKLSPEMVTFGLCCRDMRK